MTAVTPWSEPIAVIGMGCRFPGGAEDPAAYWRMLAGGVDGVCEVPISRWDIDEFYDPDPDAPGKTYTRFGGFMGPVDRFEPQFFNISPREAISLDPQQRLLLEVTWEALENANLVPAALEGSSTGVFVGVSSSEYLAIAMGLLQAEIVNRIDAYFGTGNALSTLSGRVSYTFRWTGPNLALDTACSASHVATHLACQSLRLGECDLAVAGGVNMILGPGVTIVLSKARMMAPDGRCKVFDAAADGYVRGEGCGTLVLKRMADAVADGDRILALVRGSAMNQDGPSSGLTVPSGPSQVSVIRQALATAGVRPEDIGYLEAHGTGTQIGDPIEAGALREVFGSGDRSEHDPLYVGSVKTNIGHLEAGAGVAGTIKSILALGHRLIPPNLHFDRINPLISWDDRLRVPTEPVPWPGDRPRLAGVSAFGFSGTNVHLILEEPPAPPAVAPAERPIELSQAGDRPRLLLLSARGQPALAALAGRYATALAGRSADEMADVCYTARHSRSRFRERLALVATSADEAAGRLERFAGGVAASGVVVGHATHRRPRVAFLFTGQGSQYPGMAQRLHEHEPVFRAALDRCDELLRPHLERPLLSVLFADGRSNGLIHQTAFTQPALFAVEYALAALLADWGVEPDVVMGHSVGEYVAACVAGVFDLAEGLELIAARGRLMQSLPAGGRMVALFAGAERIEEALEPHRASASIAAYNGPENIVVSGEAAAVGAVVGALVADGVEARELEVSHAFHSPAMDPILDEFHRIASRLEYRRPDRGLVSNVEGRLAEGDEIDATYWRRHVREPVRFTEGVAHLGHSGCDVVVEIGPAPVLLGLARRALAGNGGGDGGRQRRWISTLRRDHDDRRRLLTTAGELFCAGVDVDWEAFDRPDAPRRRRVDAPLTCFDRKRYWIDMDPDEFDEAGGASASVADLAPHPLLGRRIGVAGTDDIIFEARIGIRSPAYLGDHVILGKAFHPGAAYAAAALEAGAIHFRTERLVVEDAIIQEPLVLADNRSALVQLLLRGNDPASVAFELHSLDPVKNRDRQRCHSILHGGGRIRRGGEPPARPADHLAGLLEPPPGAVSISPAAFYQQGRQVGYQYGPRFQTVTEIRWMKTEEPVEALLRVALTGKALVEADDYIFHPALLDGCLQAAIRAFGDHRVLSLPVRLSRLAVHVPHARALWAHARVRPPDDPTDDERTVEIEAFDDDGVLVVDGVGVTRRADRRLLLRALHGSIDGWLYRVDWQPRPPATVAPPAGETRRWLVVGDGAGLGEAIAGRLVARGDTALRLATADEEGCRIATGEGDLHGVVHVAALDLPELADLDGADLLAAETALLGGIVDLVRALASTTQARPPGLWLATAGAQAVGDEDLLPAAAQATLWGLGRVIAMEHPELRPVRVDLDPSPEADRTQELFDTIWFADAEDQIAYREGTRHVARLLPVAESGSAQTLPVAAPGEPFQVAIARYGLLDDLRLAPAERRQPGPGEVEIRVRAAGLNFRDVLNALGMLRHFAEDLGIDAAEDLPFGGECAGIVEAVGEGVEDLAVGDAVVAGMAIGSLARFVVVRAEAVLPLPEALSFEEAATIPTAFLTALHGLVTLARIEAGDRILIHAAAGGVGQAAVQLARRVGAEVFATASPAKHDFLRQQGIEHVMNSRTLDYADQILEATGGRGVDVVLNCLAGEFAVKNLDALAEGGRYVELGKLGVLTAEQVAELRPDVTFLPFDLLEIALEDPDLLRGLLADLAAQLTSGALAPLPYRAFEMTDLVSAFRFMAQARHIGKVVLTVAPDEAAPDEPAPLEPATADGSRPLPIRADRSYLITGGLGALGIQVAQWMAMEGARHLVLVGRRPAGDEATRAAVESLEEAGASVRVESVDVARAEDVGRLLAAIESDGPPLAGVVHAAGVLDDGVLLHQTRERFESVLAPKVAGLWNLDRALAEAPLDFFIAFSSISALLGSPGQSNYAAANAFMDALMVARQRAGRPGLSIDWGAWAESGMAVDRSRRYQDRQSALGIRNIPPILGLVAMEEAARRDPGQIAVLPIDWSRFFQVFPMANEVPLLEAFHTRSGGVGRGGAALLEALQAMPAEERIDRALDHLRAELARILGLPSADDVDPTGRLLDFGLDSLMAIELKNSLETGLGRSLPATMILNHPTLESIVRFLVVDLLDLGPES